MKLLRVTVTAIAVFIADGWGISNKPWYQETSGETEEGQGISGGPDFATLVFTDGLEKSTPTYEDELMKESYLLLADENQDKENAKEQDEQHVTNLRKGSKCKSNIVCSLLRGSCISNSSNCSGRVEASVCKGSKCKCCIEVDLQTELKSMVVNLTDANSNMNTRIEALISVNSNQSNTISNLDLKINSLTKNLTDANSELTNELQFIKENQGTNGTMFGNLKEEIETFNDNINRSLTLLNSVAVNFTCPGGFFKIPQSTNQCFKTFRDRSRTWFQAKQKCEDERLVLAKPLDPGATRRYLLGTYGTGHNWINARGSGYFVKWGDGQSIPNSSPLWMDGEPGSRLTNSNCMWLQSYSGSYLNSGPFRMYSCTYTGNSFALCEWVPT